MANDITTAISGEPVNVKSAIVSVLPTGKSSKLIIRDETEITISSIESKYDNRFDDPSYYYGIGNASVVGG